jgi:anti-sigma regulatory factor (Ser/Thr protein kinase)
LWNGAIPSVYLLSGKDGRIKHKFEATHPPLGILPPDQFDDALTSLQIEQRDQVFMATDGVIEQRDSAGEMFGEARLERILDAVVEITELAQVLGRELAEFCAEVGQADDMTFVAVRAESGAVPVLHDEMDAGIALSEPDWSLRMLLEPEALRRINPVPVLNNLVRELNGGAAELVNLELALGELYKNALDHGVLGLASEQKHSADGFDAYYRLRETRLAELQAGHVAIDIVNHPSADGGVVELQISDTGNGFDHGHHLTAIEQNLFPHGRGIALVKALCRDLEYTAKGNRAKALFRWKT